MRPVEMTKSIDKSVEEIFQQSIKNTFVEKTEEVKEELTIEEKRRIYIAKAIEEAQAARKLAKEQEELEEAKTALHKSENATTSGEKEKEIVEKNVKNKIEINPDMKEGSIVGEIYKMYNNKYLSEKQYTLTNADKKGNTPAWQNRDKKNVKTGEPLYKKADHMKKEEVEAVDEKISASGYARAKKWKEAQAAKKDRDDNAKWEEKARTHKWDGKTWNKRDKPTHDEGQGPHAKKAAAANAKESVEYEAQKKTLTIEDTDKLYLLKANGDVAYEVTDLLLPDPIVELNRYAKETGKNTGSMNKRAGSSVQKGGSKDKALNFVRSKIRKETGKPEGQRKKVKGAKSNDKTGKYLDKLKSKRAYADKAKKAGFKSTQDYTNTVARYGGESNYKKGRGLGT